MTTTVIRCGQTRKIASATGDRYRGSSQVTDGRFALPLGCDLSVAGAITGYSHWYGTTSHVCTACRTAGGPEAGEWITINLSVSAQRRPDEVDGLKITLVIVPPTRPAGTGQIQVINQGETYGKRGESGQSG
ncbi:hypothetical protein ACFWMR_07295 [Amycolatopsis thailandensis]|uniref:hypothetical protein n=1 Tax=Amycolatopsis thailandensis TaxID=589330 RepID=UPI00364D45E2